MAIVMNCPNCASLFNLDDDLAGAQVRCHSCQYVFDVPNATTAVAEEPVLARIVVKTPMQRSTSRPPAPAARKSGSSAGVIALLVALGGFALFGCLGCAGGIGAWYFLDLAPDNNKPAPPPLVVADKVDVFVKDKGKKKAKVDDGLKDADKKDFDKKDFFGKDDAKKDGFKKDDDKKDGFKDKEPPAIPKHVKLALGLDGRARVDSAITKDNLGQVLMKIGNSYLIDMEAGQFYQIDMFSSEFDAYLHLIELPNTVVATDNNGGGGSQARILYKPLRSGTFHILATSPDGKDFGKYTLVVRRSIDGIVVDPLAAPPSINRNNATARIFTFNPGDGPLANLIWGHDDKSFYLLTQKGRLQRINTETGKIENEHVLGKDLRDPANLALSDAGLLVSLPDDQEIWIIDPVDLSKVKKKIAAPHVARVVAGIDARLAVASFRDGDKHGLRVIDLQTGEIRQTIDCAQHQRALAASVDGKFIFASDPNEPNKFARYLVQDNRLIFQQSSMALERLGDAITISPDLQHVWLPGRTLGATPEDSRSYLFGINNQANAALTLPTSQFAYAVAREPQTGLIYSHDANKALIIYLANGVRQAEFDLPGIQPTTVREIVMMPRGRELLIRTLDAVAHVKLLDKGAPVVKVDPPKGNLTSLVVKSEKQGDFMVRELTPPPKAGKGFAPFNYPVFDAKGNYLYWLQEGTTLLKVNRDLKVEATGKLPLQSRYLAMSSEGLVTATVTDSQLQVIDPETMNVRTKIPCPAVRFIAAAPGSSRAAILTTKLEIADLKAGKLVDMPIVNAPVNFTGYRSVAMSPDGKYLCVQLSDNSIHRLRVEKDRLFHEAARPAKHTVPVNFHFSPDGKQVALTYLGFKKGLTEVKTTEVFATDKWDDPLYTLPTPMFSVGFDDAGRIYAVTNSGELRLYANPAKANDTFQTCPLAPTIRRLLVPASGSGCLVIGLTTTSPPLWLEPAGKN